MQLHIVHVIWTNRLTESATKETVGCLVAFLEKEILLSSTYDGEFDHFPVVLSIPNEDILELKTLMLLET